MLLREAEQLIELNGEEFDHEVAEAVAQLRRSIVGELGKTTAREVLFNVGKTRVATYGETETTVEQ